MASPGLELLCALASPEISQPQDSLVCFIHWELISQGFLCLGKGEKAGANEKGSERLPDGWDINKELYILRYKSRDSNVLLKALKVDGSLIANVMDMKTEKVNNVTLRVKNYVDKEKLKDFHSMYKNKEELKQRLQTELIYPLLGSKVPSGKPERERERAPDYVPPSVPPVGSTPHSTPRENPRGNIPYGAGDLDPTGTLPGGMIFDPIRPGIRPDPRLGLPPGAVPPGARFDPFGPPGVRPVPDPDDFPPPGSENMYM